MSIQEIQKHSTIKNKKSKRVGRGIASGTGKTCGRGHKGQKSRSGVSIKGFEGGQMPIHRRLPKYGFNNPNKKAFKLINLDLLQSYIDSKLIDPSNNIDANQFLNANLIGKSTDSFKILGRGELKTKVNVNCAFISKSAREKIEKIGGKIVE